MTKEQLIALLNDMSLEEKVNQMSQVIGGFFQYLHSYEPKCI